MSTSGESEKMVETAKGPEKPCESRRAYVAKLTAWEEETKALEKSTHELSYQPAKALHEKGKNSEGCGKQVEHDAQTSANASVLPTNKGKHISRMNWERTPIPKREPEFKYLLALNENPINSEESPTTQALDIGLMAMCYDPIEGWVTSKLSPQSGHWKRKAREVKLSKLGEKKAQKTNNGRAQFLYKN